MIERGGGALRMAVVISLFMFATSISLLLISFVQFRYESITYNPASRRAVQRFSVSDSWMSLVDGVVAFEYGIVPSLGIDLTDVKIEGTKQTFPEGTYWSFGRQVDLDPTRLRWSQWIPSRSTTGALTTTTLPISPFVLISAILPSRALIIVLRRRPWRIKRRCVDCGYDLMGLPEPRCPECGRPFEKFQQVNPRGSSSVSE